MSCTFLYLYETVHFSCFYFFDLPSDIFQARMKLLRSKNMVCLLRVAQTVVGSSSEPPPMLGCHVDLFTVSRCHTGGESEDHTREKACKGSTLALKHRVDITRSPKHRYHWPHEKDLCPPNGMFTVIDNYYITRWSQCEFMILDLEWIMLPSPTQQKFIAL